MSYAVDKIGRGTSVGNNTSSTAYASGMTHRAFGGVKAMSISTTDPIEIAMGYDPALRPISYEADSAANNIEIQKADYTYLPDGLLKEVDNHADHNFDQVSEYDFAGRLKMNDVGSSGSTHPFKQTLGYDAFSNLLTRTNWTYSFDARTFTATYANNRKASGGSSDSYDVTGNVTYSHTGSPLDNIWSTFDVVGRKARWEEYGPYGDNQYKGEEITYDGDGRPAKRAELTKDRIGGVWGDWNENNKYFIYSSVTGKVVTDLNETGQLYKTHVYVGDAMIADRFVDNSLQFQVTDPLTGSTRRVGDDGAIFSGDEEESRNEQAGLGTTVPNTQPSSYPSPNYNKGGFVGGAEYGCVVDGIEQVPGACTDYLSTGTVELKRGHDQPRGILDSLGVHIYWNGNSGRSNPDPDSDSNDGHAWGDGGKWEFIYFRKFGSEVSVDPSAEFASFDTFEVPSGKDFRGAVVDFFLSYGKKFRNCIWEVFSKDRDGNESNVVQLMKTPSSKEFPYEQVTLYENIPGALGIHQNGKIGLRTKYSSQPLIDGSIVSGKENFYRTLAHEYGNYLSWYFTDDGRTFGVKGGIKGDAAAADGLRSVNIDDDTGARMEKCIWGNVSF